MCCKNLAHGAAQNCSSAQRKAANVPIGVTSHVSRQDACSLRKTPVRSEKPLFVRNQYQVYFLRTFFSKIRQKVASRFLSQQLCPCLLGLALGVFIPVAW